MFRITKEADHRSFGADVSIHPSAIIGEGASLAAGVVIGPRAVIGPHVRLARGVKVGVGAIIEGRTSVGDDTEIHPYATLGGAPQDLKYKGEDTSLVIGSRNRIHPYVNISLGTVTGSGQTTIGDNNLFMAYTHVAHDCHIGNDCIFANSVQLAGHITVEDKAVFGGLSGGHQFCRFGQYAMVAAGAVVVQDVVPYAMVHGDHATVSGLNVVGLRRAGFQGDVMEGIKRMFRLLFKQNLTLDEAIAAIEAEVTDSEQKKQFTAFVKASKRGLCR